MKIQVNKYLARVGYGVSQEKVEVIAPEIERLTLEAYNNHEAFGPHELLEIAEKKRSVFHDLFEWDDKKAAYAHRVSRARQVLACYTTVVSDSDSEIGEVRLRGTYNVAMPADDIVLEDDDQETKDHIVSLDGLEHPRRTYVPVQVAVTNEDLFKDLESRFKLALKRLRTEYIALKKVHDYEQKHLVSPIFDAIDGYLETAEQAN